MDEKKEINCEFEEQRQKVHEINLMQAEAFKKIPISERMIFTSHCIRRDLHEKIEALSQELGYRLVKAGGGSIVRKKIEQEKPKAVIGVACFRELEAIAGEIKIPFQIAMLAQDGCKDTVVDIDEVEKILRAVDKAD